MIQEEDWLGKPYYSLDAYMHKIFHEKVYRIALDGGMSCPNRDGTLDTRGCIFCSAGGSGDFAASRSLSITDQIDTEIKAVRSKRHVGRFIAYFQAFTNTYAPLPYLRRIYCEALAHPEVSVLSIATRPDCIDEARADLLSELFRIYKKPIWVELGLQTIREDTARYIRRGYPLACFTRAVRLLDAHRIETIVHLILGLPGEDMNDALRDISYINGLPVKGVKLQLLHVLRGTDLATDYLAGRFSVLTFDAYLSLVIACIAHLRRDIVIHRLTGDGPRDLLIAPLWSTSKRGVLNALHHRLAVSRITQGCMLHAFEDTAANGTGRHGKAMKKGDR